MHKVTASHIGNRFTVPAWKHALHHFQRLLIECGSPLEVEHSQRLGLLFSKNVGCDRDVELWASLFDADDVPATAMMLKALVVHNKWQTALKLLEIGCDHPNSTELGDLLAQYLVKRDLVDEAFSVVQLLSSSAAEVVEKKSDEKSVVPRKLSSSSDLLAQHAVDDTVGLATDPTYVPRDERCDMSGLGSAVLKKYPLNSEWKLALETLTTVHRHAVGNTKLKILECMIARCTYGGNAHALARQLADENPESESSSAIQRCLLFGALELGDFEHALVALSHLSKLGSTDVPRHSFVRFCQWTLRTRDTHSRATNKKCARLISENLALCPHQKMQNELRDFIVAFWKMPSQEKHTSYGNGVDTAVPRSATIAELDMLATQLLNHGQWKEALQIIEQISGVTPTNSEEKIVHNAVNESLSCWQKSLLFFT